MFQTMHWFAAERMVEDLKDMNSKGSRCPEQLIRGVRALAAALKSWTIEKDVRIIGIDNYSDSDMFSLSFYEAELKRKE